MKSQILLLALTVAALSSCTTAYKTGQTPDDVYFSPTRPQDEYVQVEKNRDKPRYESREDYYDDRYLRMRMNNRLRWSELDDYYYYGNRYDYYSYNSSFYYNPWSPCTYWNSHYNPYYTNNYVIVTPKSPTYSRPRTFNLNTYNNNILTSGSYTNTTHPGTGGGRPFTNSYNNSNNSNNNSSSNTGNFLRNIFNNNSGSSGSSNSSGSGRSSTSSSSSSSSSGSSSSGSSGGGSAPVRRF